jgi:transitional endoplasmic reticulum ATPase
MPKFPANGLTNVDAAYLPVFRLWILRALMRCKGLPLFVGERRFTDASVARLLGYADADVAKYTEPWAVRSVQRKWRAIERKPPAVPAQTMLARNLHRLADRLSLNNVECDILHFTIMHRACAEFGDALDLLGEMRTASVWRLLAECLGHPMAAVQAALDERGKLSRSALLAVDASRSYTFGGKIDLLPGLADGLMLEHEDLLSIFGASVIASPPPRIGLDRYPHLADDVRILSAYLDAAGRAHQSGVNVLVHGRPGTGKSEFVRALVHAAGGTLMEISSGEPSGAPLSGKARFESFRCAQSLLAGSDGAVLLFDEVEDVFSGGPNARDDEGNTSGVKGWVNQLLERNPVPTFWVTNHLRTIDPAYRRRFDYVLQMDMPPTSVRRRVVDDHTADLHLTECWRAGVARHQGLAPAVVERAAKVGSMVCASLADLDASQVMTRVLNNTLSALGVERLPETDADNSIDYRLDLLNADCDLARLQDGLGRVGEGRLCLYGPPGTGKTAFGHHLAQVLDRPLLVKRASDILSPYVGMAERNIAQMFREAIAEGAVLLLDEADSLLRDRQGAQRSWEVTQVNEMLTQMEEFRGIFIASTNLMNSLDAAAMRRFDACIRLDYLVPDQAWGMFAQLAGRLELTDPVSVRLELDQLHNLTPGDFAAIERHGRLDPVTNVAELMLRLRRMCASKQEPNRRPMGFIS